MKIFKYDLLQGRPILNTFVVRMPQRAKILSVQAQGSWDIMIWAAVEDRAQVVERRFKVVATGEDVDSMVIFDSL